MEKETPKNEARDFYSDPNMTTEAYNALYLLIAESGKKLNGNETAHETLAKYIQSDKCDPEAGEPFNMVFDICVELFRPEELELKLLKRRTQKEIIIFLLGKPSEEELREKMKSVMAEIEEIDNTKKITEKNLAAAENAYYKHLDNLEKVDLDRKAGVEKNDVVLEEHKEDDPKDPTKKITYYTIHHITKDNFLDGKLVDVELPRRLNDRSELTRAMEDQIKDDYLNIERPNLLNAKCEKLVEDVDNITEQLNDIDLKKLTKDELLETLNRAEKEKKESTTLDNDKKGERIVKMREELRAWEANNQLFPPKSSGGQKEY